MIAFEAVLHRIRGLDAAELERWIEARWVRPERVRENYVFHEIDVARVHLIFELTREMMIDVEAMPVILNLLDQIYRLRNRLQSVTKALETLPPDVQAKLRAHFEE
jgi:chaperone modulatory protein CbpM